MPKFEFEEIVALASISEILFKRLQCMECNQCEPCGEIFMRSLQVLVRSGELAGGEREAD